LNKVNSMKSQQSVYKGGLPSHLDSSSSNSPCSTFAFSLSLAWLLTVCLIALEVEGSNHCEENIQCC
jgi:hypothetical protein